MEYLYFYLFVGLAMTVGVYYNDIQKQGEVISFTWYDPLLGLILWPILFLGMITVIIIRVCKSSTAKHNRRVLGRFLSATTNKRSQL